MKMSSLRLSAPALAGATVAIALVSAGAPAFVSAATVQGAPPPGFPAGFSAPLPPGTSSSTATTTRAFLVADVAIRDPRILSQAGNQINVAFSLQNGLNREQPGIRYAIELREPSDKNGKPGTALDRQIAKEAIALGPHARQDRTVSYQAPSFLKGDFEVWVTSGTEGGLPLAVARAGTAKLFGSGAYISLSSCSFLDEKGRRVGDFAIFEQHKPPQLITCAARSFLPTAETTTIDRTTYAGSLYGSVISGAIAQPQSVSFAPNEGKTFSFSVGASGFDVPGTYETTVVLRGKRGEVISTPAVLRYTVAGPAAEILSFAAQSSGLGRGDTASTTLAWVNESIALPVAGEKSQRAAPPVSLELSIADAQGASCIEPIHQELVTGENAVFSNLLFTKDCSGAVATAKLVAYDGRILDTAQVAIKGSANGSANGGTGALPLLISLLILGAIGWGFILVRGKRIPAGVMHVLIFIPLLVGALSIPRTADAATVAVYNFAGFYSGVYTINLSQTNFLQSDNIPVSYSYYLPYSTIVYAGIDRVFTYSCRYIFGGLGVCSYRLTLSDGTFTPSGLLSFNSFSSFSGSGVLNFTAPTSLGSHLVGAAAGPAFGDADFVGSYASLPFNVVAPALSVTPPSLNFGTIPVGQTAQKTFTVSNTGTQTLTGTISVAGQFSSSVSNFSIPPGGSQTVTASFAPTAPVYYASTAFVNSSGGSATVALSGSGAVNPLCAPGPLQNPAACAGLTASLTAVSPIYSGQSSTLTWSSTNASTCTGGSGFNTGGATSGNTSVNPTQTTNYQLTCNSKTVPGLQVSKFATVQVVPITITASPARVVKGGTATIAWDANGLKGCRVTDQNNTLIGTGDKGSAQVTITAQSTYTISCANTPPSSVIVNVTTRFNEF